MIARIVLMVGLALASPALHAASESRTWTSKDGTATIEAKFHKLEGDRVTLILPSGRSQYVQTSFLSEADLAWIEEENKEAPAAVTGVPAAAKIPAALEGNLLDDRGNSASVLNPDGTAPKHYLFYYSASWCGPCVAFTPELVRFYRKMKARDTSFEVILVPSDKSREAEIAYLKDHRMPWPGVDFDKKAPGVPASNFGYIPSMVLVDADGKRLLEVSKSLDQDKFLSQAEDILSIKDGVASN
jgi:thiol-disulfide isomerase/thioredoxin